MLCLHSFGVLAALSLMRMANVHAIVLQNLPHSSGQNWPANLNRLITRQEDCVLLGLQSTESFIWGGLRSHVITRNSADQVLGSNGSTPVLGELIVRFPGDEENVLSMQRVKRMTKSTTCNIDTNVMEITFQDDKMFECARNLWGWVNGADNHTFVMVAGTGDCGWNDRRVPFIISTIEYDMEANIARLNAKASDWNTAVHSYQLHVGSLAIPSPSTKRSIFESNYIKDVSIDFAHNIPDTPISLSTTSDLPVSFACLDCSTRGRFEFKFKCWRLNSSFLKKPFS